jgi:hypothetical protein
MIVLPAAAGLPLARLRSRSLEVIGRRAGFPAKALARPIVLACGFASDMVDFPGTQLSYSDATSHCVLLNRKKDTVATVVV